MFIDVRPKATIALPKEVAKSLKLSTGDQLKLEVVDGVIHLTPVVVYSKTYVKQLKDELAQMKKAAEQNPELLEEIKAFVEKLASK